MRSVKKGTLIFIALFLCFLLFIQMRNRNVGLIVPSSSNTNDEAREANLKGPDGSYGNETDEVKWSKEDALFIEKAGKVVPKSFNINGRDVLVYLHIQKTGGSTFENHLLLDLKTDPPCDCWPHPRYPRKLECDCVNKNGNQYLFQRQSLGWPCGVHADFTELTSCVEKHLNEVEDKNRRRIYHYTTTLREPMRRFISEWRFVKKGATWIGNEMICDGRAATFEELPPCFDETWRGVSLTDFLACESNLAFNRQTRMLANLSLSDCYRRDSRLTQQTRDAIMLRSAKKNLATYFEYFGLTEYQYESGLLFQKTFPEFKFNLTSFERHPTVASEEMDELHPDMLEQIRQKNLLDIELYKFAKEIYLRRLQNANIPVEKDPY